MSAWRERGFVPDSEDEDEQLETQSSEHLPPESSNEDHSHSSPQQATSAKQASSKPIELSQRLLSSQYAEKDAGLSLLQAPQSSFSPVEKQPSQGNHNVEDDDRDELSSDLPMVGDFLGRPKRTEHSRNKSPLAPLVTNFDSDGSSGLSSPPSNLSSPEPAEHPIYFTDVENLRARGNTHPQVQIVVESRRDNGQILDHEEQELIFLDAPLRSRRNFRQRKAIQLHPYALEGERYRQALKSRGIKPINAGIHRGLRVQEVEESQDVEVEYESSVSNHGTDHSAANSQQNVASSTPATVHSPLSQQDLRLDEEEELPDISAVLNPTSTAGRLNRHATGFRVLGKRGRPRKDRPQAATSAVEQPQHHESVGISGGPASRSKSPDSPFHIRSPPRKKFRTLHARSPSGLPTPQTSSSIRPRSRVVISEDSDSDSTPKSTTRHRPLVRPSRPVDPIVVPSSGSESEPEKLITLKRYKRKIKGVLPASWLRLDQQAQLKRNEASHRPPASPPSISREHSPSHSRVSIGNAPSLPDSDKDVTEAPLEPHDHFRDSSPTPVDLTFGEVVEYDWIDPMAPSHTRPSAYKPRKKKRQLKLHEQGVQRSLSKTQDVRFEDEQRRSSKRAKTSNSTQRRSEFSNQRKSSQKRLPRRSILDVPQPSPDTNEPLPQFIRLAQRQARKTEGEGRYSPSNKYVRLHTEADTADAIGTLQSWKAGSIPRRKKSPATGTAPKHRTPLQARNANPKQQRLPPPLSKVPSDTESNIQNTIRSEAVEDASTPQKRQSRLEPLIFRISPRDHQPRIHEVRNESNVRLYKKRLLQRPTYRTAQLEEVDNSLNGAAKVSTFQQSLRSKDRTFFERLKDRNLPDNPLVERFLAEDSSLQVDKQFEDVTVIDIETDVQGETVPVPKKPTRKPRKVRPKRLDVQAREYRQPSDPLPVQRLPSPEELPQVDSEGFHGLGPYGTRYSTDFDVLPLEFGTFFHQDTFLGSGDFRACFQLEKRDLDHETGFHVVQYQDQRYRWSFWSENVASDLSSIVQKCLGDLDHLASTTSQAELEMLYAQTSTLLRSISRYFSKTLCFLDSVDRQSFVDRVLDLFSPFFETLSTCMARTYVDQVIGPNNPLLVQANMFSMVVAAVIENVSRHSSIEAHLARKAEQLLLKTCNSLASYILTNGMDELKAYLNENRYHLEREKGLHSDKPFIEAIVVIFHLLSKHTALRTSFGTTVSNHFTSSVNNTRSVPTLDNIWYNIFTLLPYFEFDQDGLLRVGSRMEQPLEVWGGVKSLLSRTFNLYQGTPSNPALNAYVRAVLTRCHHLIQAWGWRRAESVMGVIFDFFGRNNLAPLAHEEYRGSPRFLEELQKEGDLEVQPDDRAFHIFLKMLAISLKALRRVYSDKKIQGTVYRFIPNHGRTYRKDMPVRQEDLDALRNHHDLLCVLYWASPEGFRPRIDLLRNLVDHSSSHREACRLNVRSWSLLVRFQISTEESSESIETFGVWCRELIEQTTAQYRFARTEAEAQYELAQKHDSHTIAPELLQTTITNNQTHSLTVLSDVIGGMRSALKCSRDEAKSKALVQQSSFTEILKLFDPKNQRANRVVIEALATVRELLKPRSESDTNTAGEDATRTNQEEDSQDYGDFPDMDDVSQNINPPTNTEDLVTDPLWHLLSNCFGADKSPDHAVLSESIITWVANINYSVRTKQKQTATYLDAYSQISWQQLRNTEQRHIYTPYFMATLLESQVAAFEECPSNFFSEWLISLVERDARLRFQHCLTTALLNANTHNALLRNLPFARSTPSRFDISLEEFRAVRLGLISSVFSNMRDELERLAFDDPSKWDVTQREYSLLLKQIMDAMKKNYSELQQGGTVTGAYVDFVHTVVEFLQQFTSDIRPVDRFFTDSAAFPLPSDDPTYVVGRLKGYALKARSSKNAKQLAVFLQNVSERAAIDQQQPYLVLQLQKAVSGSRETGLQDFPTLRRILLEAVFPAYVQMSLQTASGWLLAQPILQVCRRIFSTILYDFSATDHNAIESVFCMVSGYFQLLCKTVEIIINQVGLLEEPHILRVLSLIFENVSAILPPLDYILRIRELDQSVSSCVNFVKALGEFVTANLLGELDAPEPIFDVADNTINNEDAFTDTRQFCTRELQRSIHGNWSKQSDVYVFISGKVRRQVNVDLKAYDMEKLDLLNSIHRFNSVLETMPAFVEQVYNRGPTMESMMAELVV